MIRLLLALLLFPLGLTATQLRPWFGIEKEIEWRSSYRLQGYPHHIDHYFDLSLSAAYEPEINAELELLTAIPRHSHYRVDAEKATGRYLLLDDVSGESPFSLVAGAAFTHVHRPALDDRSNLYHGRFQFEGILSAGKENSCGEFWTTRYWSTLVVGKAEKYAPWMELRAAWEKNWWDLYEMGLSAKLDWGFGHRHLSHHHHFHGYGPIEYRLVNLAAYYRYWISDSAQLTAEYRYRIFAHNAPKKVRDLTLTLLIPIDL
jgi:hypothetical protein